MRSILWMVLLVALPGVLCRPSRFHKKAQMKRQLVQSLLRKFRQQAGNNCRELSESFGELLGHESEIAELVPNVVAVEANEALTDRFFGFDIYDDDMRATFTCSVAGATTLSELKDVLERDNFLFSMFRTAYDVMALMLPVSKSNENPREVLEYLSAVEATGLLGLDPQGVELFKEAVVQGNPDFLADLAGYEPTPELQANNTVKCNHLFEAFRALRDFSEAVSAGAAPDDTFETFTGIDISDNAQVKKLICDIIDGASSNGLRGVYDAFDNNNVINSLFKSVYPLLQSYIPLGIQFINETMKTFQQLQDLTPNSPGGPNNLPNGLPPTLGGGGFGGYYPNQLPENYQEYFNQIPQGYQNHINQIPQQYPGYGDYGYFNQMIENYQNYINQIPPQYQGYFDQIPPQYQGYFDQVPVEGNSVAQSEDDPQQEMAELIRLMEAVLDFLQKLDESGILSLPDDIQ